jgi:peptidoglycan-N-acetylglucosamine deacetylase
VLSVVAVALLLTAGPAAAEVPRPKDCRGYAAVTFDDGPRAPFTEDLLDVLAARRVHATFFVVGRRVDALPEVVRRTRREGHQVFTHTYSHARLGNDAEPKGLDYRGTTAEIRRGHEGVEAVLGRAVARRWRSPFLRYRHSDVVQRASKDLGFVHVGGSTTKDQDPAYSDADVLKRARSALDKQGDGTVLIFHDGVANAGRTVKLVPRVVDDVHRRGICTASIGPAGTVLARPHRPTAQLTRVGSGVRLNWSPTGPASAAPAGYRVYRSTTTTRPDTHLVATKRRTYTDTAARRGTTYYYWIEGRNEAGNTRSLRYKIRA